MGARRSRRLIRAALLIVGAAALSSCGGAVLNGLYFLETPRRTFVDQRFDRDNDWEWSYSEWSFGPRDRTDYGGPLVDYTYDIRDGYFISYNGPNYAVANDVRPGNAEVIVQWELWDSYSLGGEDNGFDYDFRIVLDSSDGFGADPRGPVVELKLFSLDALGVIHSLRVRDGVDPAAAFSVAENDPAIATTRGALRVVFRLNSETPTITAQALDETGDPFLQVSHEMPGGWEQNVRYFVEAVGGYFFSPVEYVEPRVIDSIIVLSPEPEP